MVETRLDLSGKRPYTRRNLVAADDDFSRISADLPEPFRLLIRPSVGSTNDELRILAEQGASSGLVLLANRQLAGRGRRGAPWISPPGESLTFSILLRPQEIKALWPRLALIAGLAVAEALENFTPITGIKWPNDVWIGDRKVAGILVEAGSDYAIVGIGINVNTESFPPELAEIATSIREVTGETASRPEVLSGVLRHFSRRSRQIGQGFEDVIADIRLRCVLTGHSVSLETSDGSRHGVVEGISSGGELLLKTSRGLERLLQADSVRMMSF